MIGLYGKNGIVPIKSISDKQLKILVFLGIASSIIGFFFPIILGCAWLIYHYFYRKGYPFLSFQWDALLIETGFISIFYLLLTPPPLILHVAMWVLLFKLMFSSGLVKWVSGCPKWRIFRALDYHFETQPLPNMGGFLAHQLMQKGTKIVAIFVFAFELLIPLLYFGNASMRILGAILTIFFQVTIITTGNYAFFNLLTIALCIPLFSTPPIGSGLFAIVLNGVGALFILYNVLLMTKQFLPNTYPILGMNKLRRLGILNTYGLFAVMTTIRDEIIVEGSMDQETWQEYVFKYKPGLSSEGVKQIAPFQPRLDWQMWFAALGNAESEYWFLSFAGQLLQGKPEVLSLLKENPFPDQPPTYLRAMRYRFQFNTIREWRETGKLWKKEFIGVYLPISSLRRNLPHGI